MKRMLFCVTWLLSLSVFLTSCGQVKETEGLLYKLDDNSYMVTGYGGESTSIVIPDTKDGVMVTWIDSKVFKGKKIKDVKIGKNVEWIDLSVFEDCHFLESISLPDGLDTIRGYAFKGCISLSEIEIPSSCWFIGYHAFYGWRSNQTIVIKGSSSQFEEGWNEGCSAKIVYR